MSFPRIDHPEFAEFIRRFYGVSRSEPDPRQAPVRERAEVRTADPTAPTRAATAAGRRGVRPTNGAEEQG